MRFVHVEIPGVVLIEPDVFGDHRGFFFETYHHPQFVAAGIDLEFVQDNHSGSSRDTLRGLHYQIQQPQGKLVRTVRGEIWDVAVDLRRTSATCGKWFGTILSESNRTQIYVPPGFAHGFAVLSETAEVVYKCTNVYAPEFERTILWSDPDLAIEWPITQPILSGKDRAGTRFSEAELFP